MTPKKFLTPRTKAECSARIKMALYLFPLVLAVLFFILRPSRFYENAFPQDPYGLFPYLDGTVQILFHLGTLLLCLALLRLTFLAGGHRCRWVFLLGILFLFCPLLLTYSDEIIGLLNTLTAPITRPLFGSEWGVLLWMLLLYLFPPVFLVFADEGYRSIYRTECSALTEYLAEHSTPILTTLAALLLLAYLLGRYTAPHRKPPKAK